MREGYKKTPIGDIPCDWKVSILSDFTDEVTDYVAAGSFASLRENVNVFSESNHAIYVRLTDLRKGLGHSEQKYVDKDSYEFLSKSNLYGREILFANIGANVGEVWMMPEIEKEATVAPNMIVIRANNENVIPEYLHAYFRSSIGLRQIDKIIAGSGHPKVNKTELRRLSVILPPLPEQQKIAEILSTVDAKTAIIDQQITETQELKKGLMQRLLTKGIGHTEFKDSALGEIPVGWEVVKINEVTSYVDYRGKTPPKVNSGILLVTARNIKMGKIDYEVSKEFIPSDLYDSVMSRGVPKIGDVLITTEAPLGNIASVDNKDIALAQRVIKYRGNKDVLDNNYLKQYMIGSVFQQLLEKQSTGSTVKGIKGSVLHKLNIALPPFAEQQKIAIILSTVDKKLEVLSEKKTTYQELKKGLMQQLLTGLVRVKV
jgi:type I restriction enzyme S subunit